jgi:WD40 repeat protein
MFSAAITDKIAAVVTADDVLVWDSNGADTFRSLNIKNTISLKLSIVPDSNLIVFGSGERLVLGDAVTNKPLRIWNSEAAVIEGFAVDPNGKYVASAGFKQGSVKLWDLGTGDEVVGVTQLPADALVLAFNRRGTKLAGEFSTQRMGEQIIIWSVPDLSRLASFPAGDEGVRAIAFDWEAGRLALLTWDGFLKIFDLPSGKLRKTLTSADCDTLAMNGSATLLACGGRYLNFVRLWRLRDAELVGNLYSIGTEDWVVESPGGYYDCSERAIDLVGWKVGLQVVPPDKLRQNRRVPGLLARAVEK